ncbi:hypothetical protein SAMN04488065_0075 [Haloplanus vescus]|uniref:Lipoprotein LpqN n=1 Tax=Haloplanus vescus TaxID=555874 RepID=A0A1H3VNA1_9EURY|nr:DUF6517 family protein [Haloplanus vescus]SDZ75734.1 hypothetical protein SAMN04488065_0075 [Haloplanus vescus]
MHTRRGVVTLAAGALATTAGCGFITGEGALEFTASPATVADSTVEESPYEETNVTDQTVEREFSAAGQTRTVTIVNQLAQYERQVDMGPLGSERAAVFVTYTSPQVEIAGKTFNPIEDMSETAVLQQFESQYDGVTVGEQVDQQSVATLGQSTSVSKFEGTASLAGSQMDVYLHATKFQHGSDFVVAVAIYPQQLSNESEQVVSLLQGLEHATE